MAWPWIPLTKGLQKVAPIILSRAIGHGKLTADFPRPDIFSIQTSSSPAACELVESLTFGCVEDLKLLNLRRIAYKMSGHAYYTNKTSTKETVGLWRKESWPEIGVNLICNLPLQKGHVLISDEGYLSREAGTYTIKVKGAHILQIATNKCRDIF